MTRRDRERLQGVHPELVAAIARVCQTMADASTPVFVVEGVRSLARQRLLYARGRTEKGPVVTQCDGVRKRSHHQPHADGFGYAVDLAFVSDEPFADRHPWAQLGRVVKAEGLRWGGDFSTLPDRPHVELQL